jgi:sialic acid synthase SpsE
MVKVFIIAEAGVNHNGCLNTAKKLADVAQIAGADAIKFQVWKTSEIIELGTQTAEYQFANAGDRDQHKMLKALEVNYTFLKEVYQHCKKIGIEFMCTADDVLSLNEIDSLLLRYKVGSGDLDNYLLLNQLAKKKKPIILSTGLSNIDRVLAAVKYLTENGYDETKISLLQCTSCYPTIPEELNLSVIETYRIIFPRISFVGFSDHSLGFEATLVALGLGARIFEKHITLDKNMKGPDHLASLSPKEFNCYVTKLKSAAKTLGSPIKMVTHGEIKNKNVIEKFVFAKKEIKAGTQLSIANLRLLRTNRGKITAHELPSILGMIVKNRIPEGEPICRMDLDV